MGGLFRADGTVSATALGEAQEWLKDRQMPVLVGIILSVKPSDSKENYTALNHDDSRGYRHECTVLASDDLSKEPDILIPHCIIPPGRHSGIDNFDEDLPHGCSSMIDGSEYKDSLEGIDYSKIDGEWCLVSFVGGNIENPYIMGWWPHPSNVFDPATSGYGNDEKSLEQFNEKTNRSRFVRRINGTIVLVNKQGSLYLDTSEANSTVKVKDGKLERTLVDKGGHIQVDLCKKAQLEWNFNEKEHKNPRIGAGSTATEAVTDEDLLHADQPVSGSVKERETNRSYARWTEFTAFLKSSGMTVFCEDTSGADGETGDFVLQAQTSVVISQQPEGGSTATLSIKDGKIQLVAADGTQINILEDEIQIVSKGGSLVSVKGSEVTVSAATVALAGSIAVSGAMSVSDGNPATSTEAALKGESYLDEEETMLDTLKLYLTAAGTAWPTTVAPTGSAAGTAASNAVTAIEAFLAKKSTFKSTTTKMA
jgi:hypothetical protein